MRTAILAAVTAAVVLPGCGGEVPRGRVYGTVKFQGQPLTGATLVFMAKDNKTHTAELKPDGSYEVSGVALGPVKVSVQPAAPRSAVKGEFDRPSSRAKGVDDEKAGKEPVAPTPPKGGTPAVGAQYADADKSGLAFELTAADQEWSVDLK